MKSSVLLAAYCLFASNSVIAQSSKETWRCQEFGLAWDKGKQVLVVARHDGHDGTIEVAGETQNAIFAVTGFDRRWDFGFESGAHYSFVIQPDGKGAYFDFGFADKDGKASARQVLLCKVDDATKPTEGPAKPTVAPANPTDAPAKPTDEPAQATDAPKPKQRSKGDLLIR
jgi:hypothetical protein